MGPTTTTSNAAALAAGAAPRRFNHLVLNGRDFIESRGVEA